MPIIGNSSSSTAAALGFLNHPAMQYYLNSTASNEHLRQQYGSTTSAFSIDSILSKPGLGGNSSSHSINATCPPTSLSSPVFANYFQPGSHPALSFPGSSVSSVAQLSNQALLTGHQNAAASDWFSGTRNSVMAFQFQKQALT